MKEELSAFPSSIVLDTDKKQLINAGMTLRDYFAAKAMQGILSVGNVRNEALNLVSKNAYCIADQMLKQREL